MHYIWITTSPIKVINEKLQKEILRNIEHNTAIKCMHGRFREYFKRKVNILNFVEKGNLKYDEVEKIFKACRNDQKSIFIDYILCLLKIFF